MVPGWAVLLDEHSVPASIVEVPDVVVAVPVAVVVTKPFVATVGGEVVVSGLVLVGIPAATVATTVLVLAETPGATAAIATPVAATDIDVVPPAAASAAAAVAVVLVGAVLSTVASASATVGARAGAAVAIPIPAAASTAAAAADPPASLHVLATTQDVHHIGSASYLRTPAAVILFAATAVETATSFVLSAEVLATFAATTLK